MSYPIRTLRPSDLPALVELLRRSAQADLDESVPTLDELERNMAVTGYRPEYCVVATTVQDGSADMGPQPSAGAGGLVGFCGVFDVDSSGKGMGVGTVHPAHRRRGIGAMLTAAADEVFRARHAHLPTGEPVYVLRTVRPGVGGADQLLLAQGYRAVRRHWAMAISLAPPMPPVEMPSGFHLRPFVGERDKRGVYECITEAFRDHWGFTEPAPFDVWESRTTGDRRHDPDLYLVAYDGEEIAGACLGSSFAADRPERAWVGSLGVRRASRRRGLGGSLLRHSFHVFQTKGYTEAALGVDSENLTGAVALYTGAGMTPIKDFVSYRKVLGGMADRIPG
jgi:mycothiol synthase